MTYLRLCKPALSGLAAAATAAGYLVAAPRFSAGVVWAGLGVFLLAAGAGALNQYQERELDRRMERTKGRPLPSGLLLPEPALAWAILLAAAGLAALSRGGTGPVVLGAVAVVWYNGVYTPLKKTSPMAAVPGALSGAMAPLVGGAFAGARLDDTRVAVLALVLFIWQIPHFWLVVLERVRDFRQAGLPTLLDLLPEARARRVVAQWVLGTAAATMVVSGLGWVGFPATRWALLLISLWLAAVALRFRASPLRLERSLFRTMNVHMAALLLLVCCDRLLV